MFLVLWIVKSQNKENVLLLLYTKSVLTRSHLFQGAIQVQKLEKLNLTGCKLQITACTSSVTQTCMLPTTFCIIELYNWVRAGKAGLIGHPS